MQTMHKLFLIIALLAMIYLDIINWKPESRITELPGSNFGTTIIASSSLPGCETWHSELNTEIYGEISNDT